MKLGVFILFTICLGTSFLGLGQVIFSESFDEATDATTGNDDTGGISWTSTCPGSLDVGDYFKVQGGALVGQDTNGPASWETADIDISSCDFIEITLDLSEEGTMEACETGCNSVDYVQLEYNIDGAGWVSPPDAEFCAGECADVFVIHSDDIDGGSLAYSTGCLPAGDNIRLRITIQAWASSERWIIDNVALSCVDGAPVGAGDDLTVCEGTAVTLTADNPTGADLTWTDGVTDGVSFTPPVGVEEYVVTASGGTCSGTDTVVVTVLEIVTASVDAAGPFTTASGLQTLSATPAGGTWSASCGGCINPTTGVFDPAAAGVGSWEVCYTAGTAPCDNTACVTIVVTAAGDCLLSGAISSNNPSCFEFSDGSVTISVTGEVGDMTIVITNEDDEVVNSDGSNTANTLPEGWYYFNVTDEVPCTFIDSVFIDDPDQMDVSTVVQNASCFGASSGRIDVDAVINYTGGLEDVSYYWVPNPSGTDGLGVDSLVNIPAGEYVLTVNDSAGCSVIKNITVGEPTELTFVELYANPAYCRLYGYQIGHGRAVAAATGGTPNYSYEWTNLTTGATTAFTTWGGLNPGTYQMTVRDSNNCLLTGTVEVDSLNPTADFEMTSPQFTSNYEGTAVVDVEFTNLSSNFANEFNPLADTIFYWNFGYGESILSEDFYEKYDTSYYSAGTYEVCLRVQNQNGCYDSLCKNIVVYDPFDFKPVNIFTPNGDGINDLFTFANHAKSINTFTCLIFNRWGVKVGELNAINEAWDGTLKNGNLAPEGVYFYKYAGRTFSGDDFEGQGNIQLVVNQ